MTNTQTNFEYYFKKKYVTIGTLVVILIILGSVFYYGYNQDLNKKDENGNSYSLSHNLINGGKVAGICSIVLIVVSLFTLIVFHNPLVALNCVQFIGQLIGLFFEMIFK